MKKLKLEVEIKKIEVSEEWYEIHYEYLINGKELKKHMYDGDYDNGMNIKEWEETLESGLAMEYAVGQIVDRENFES